MTKPLFKKYVLCELRNDTSPPLVRNLSMESETSHMINTEPLKQTTVLYHDYAAPQDSIHKKRIDQLQNKIDMKNSGTIPIDLYSKNKIDKIEKILTLNRSLKRKVDISPTQPQIDEKSRTTNYVSQALREYRRSPKQERAAHAIIDKLKKLPKVRINMDNADLFFDGIKHKDNVLDVAMYLSMPDSTRPIPKFQDPQGLFSKLSSLHFPNYLINNKINRKRLEISSESPSSDSSSMLRDWPQSF